MVEGWGELVNNSLFNASNNPDVAALPDRSSLSVKTKVELYAFKPNVVLELLVLPPWMVYVWPLKVIDAFYAASRINPKTSTWLPEVSLQFNAPFKVITELTAWAEVAPAAR